MYEIATEICRLLLNSNQFKEGIFPRNDVQAADYLRDVIARSFRDVIARGFRDAMARSFRDVVARSFRGFLPKLRGNPPNGSDKRRHCEARSNLPMDQIT